MRLRFKLGRVVYNPNSEIKDTEIGMGLGFVVFIILSTLEYVGSQFICREPMIHSSQRLAKLAETSPLEFGVWSCLT